MHTHSLKISALAFVAALFVAGSSFADDAAAAPASKWRIDCSGGTATADGQAQFRVTTQGGAPVVVTVKIARGRGDHFILEDTVAAFKAQLPADHFHTDMAADKVLIKTHKGDPDFLVEVVEAAVPGIRFHLTRN